MNVSRQQLENIARIAATEGEDAARAAIDEMETFGDDIDDSPDPCHDEAMENRDDLYVAGAGEYDSFDSKGRPLRPYKNDAGEPWWM